MTTLPALLKEMKLVALDIGLNAKNVEENLEFVVHVDSVHTLVDQNLKLQAALEKAIEQRDKWISMETGCEVYDEYLHNDIVESNIRNQNAELLRILGGENVE